MHLPERQEMIRLINRPAIDAFMDPKACYEGETIESVEGFAGNCIFLQACDGCCSGTCLVRVKEIAFVESDETFRYMSRLAGEVVWGDVPWTQVDIDRRHYYAGRGWKERGDFRNFMFGFPDSVFQLLVREAEYHVVRAKGFDLVTQTKLDATDLVTDGEISWAQNTTAPPSCSRVVQTRCTNFICRQNCEVILDGSTLGDCNCPDGFIDNPLGSCFWMDWSRCVPITCRPPALCRRSLFGCTCR